MTKILWATYKPELQLMQVTVEDAEGTTRRIDFKWLSKDPSPLPPHWQETVEAEVEFQRTEEHAKKMGRFSF